MKKGKGGGKEREGSEEKNWSKREGEERKGGGKGRHPSW